MRTFANCLRQPIPEIFLAADMLKEALNAYKRNDRELAIKLILGADMPQIRDWTNSLWGKSSPYVKFMTVENAPIYLSREQRLKQRMPNSIEKTNLLSRDGYHCRFCSIPVIRSEVRKRIVKSFPEISIWGNTTSAQHAAFQAMWVQYDHLLPHSRGGSNAMENMVITCAPCNFSRMQYTLEEVGLFNPLLREPYKSDWDGLESF